MFFYTLKLKFTNIIYLVTEQQLCVNMKVNIKETRGFLLVSLYRASFNWKRLWEWFGKSHMVIYMTPSVEGPKPPSIGWLQPYLDRPFSGLRPFLAQCAQVPPQMGKLGTC